MRVTRKLSGSSEFDFFFGIVVLFGGLCALGCASSNNDQAEREELKARVEKLEGKMREIEEKVIRQRMQRLLASLREIEEKVERQKMQQIPASERADFSPGLSADKVQATQDEIKKIEGGIRQVGPNSYEVDRKLMDEWLNNPTKFQQHLPKIVPDVKDRKFDGFRFFGIRPNSLFSILGIRNGDVINEINNQDVTNPDLALKTYIRLRGANKVTISITRHNKPLILTYTIQ